MSDASLTPLESKPVGPWGVPCLTGSFVIGECVYPTYAYPLSSSSRTWPSEVAGIYSVSGVYLGNEGRNLVGKTSMEGGFRARWLGHRSDARQGDHGNPYFQASFNRHPDQFVFWVLETHIPDADLGKREAFWYEYLQSDKTLHGWNIQKPTDDGTCRIADETKEKLRQINLGHKHTEETKRKMSETRQREGTWNRGLTGPDSHRYGKKLSPERCRQISERMTGEKHFGYGKQHTEEHKDKISLNNPRRLPFRLRSVKGEIRTFESARVFAREHNVTESSVRWFLRIASIGETFCGWTLFEPSPYPRKVIKIRVPPALHLQAPNGDSVVVHDIRAFCKEQGFNEGKFRHFASKAEAGKAFNGFIKTQPYIKESYVERV